MKKMFDTMVENRVKPNLQTYLLLMKAATEQRDMEYLDAVTRLAYASRDTLQPELFEYLRFSVAPITSTKPPCTVIV